MTPSPMTPEEIIQWLEAYRRLMFEIWKKNPQLRKDWERLNHERTSGRNR